MRAPRRLRRPHHDREHTREFRQAAMGVPLKARILLADDHVLVREGLRLILDRQPDLEVVAEAGDGAEAVDRALRADLDLAVLDVSMHG
jgi:PleD family two-component response regulator